MFEIRVPEKAAIVMKYQKYINLRGKDERLEPIGSYTVQSFIFPPYALYSASAADVAPEPKFDMAALFPTV